MSQPGILSELQASENLVSKNKPYTKAYGTGGTVPKVASKPRIRAQSESPRRMISSCENGGTEVQRC